MRKTENINIGGQGFIINQDAFLNLERYLTDLENHFKGHEGSSDIMEDIEIRIAELFEMELKSREIIEQKDLLKVISVMGTVNDLNGNIDEINNEAFESSIKTGKKLFRNRENGIIGGVCSGLASYLGIDEPIWVRLFFIFTIWVGFTPLLYVIFWIITPEAKTSSDKLAMHGEPINIENMVKNIEEEFHDLKDRFNKFGEDLKSKKGK